jgi:ABC-type Fe3+-hydroxamate transport system substrate-binding protein
LAKSFRRSTFSGDFIGKVFDGHSQSWSKKHMKVISMVPSWTELLIECGVNVVGRTRFCIHPQNSVQKIAAVGGTKDLDRDKLRDLNADLLILDQEENLPWMKEESPIPVLVTHVTSVESVEGEIRKMAMALPNSAQSLNQIANRWQGVSEKPKPWNWNKIPAELEVIRRDHESYKKLVYVIWKKPWMSVSKETFIGSMIKHLGGDSFIPDFAKKYSEFNLSDFDLNETYFLFSSEPFPFHKKKSELMELGIQGSIVDGEKMSWFGYRSLLFLESLENRAASRL